MEYSTFVVFEVNEIIVNEIDFYSKIGRNEVRLLHLSFLGIVLFTLHGVLQFQNSEIQLYCCFGVSRSHSVIQ